MFDSKKEITRGIPLVYSTISEKDAKFFVKNIEIKQPMNREFSQFQVTYFSLLL